MPNKIYEKDIHPRQAVIYIEAGYTDQEIAEKMGIQRSTLSTWKSAFPEFKKAFKDARESYVKMQCSQVVQKLYQRCMGFEYEETEVITEVSPNGKVKKVKGNSRIKKTKKYSLPDVSAMKVFLYNRDKENWGERQSIDVADNTDYDAQRAKIEKLFEEIKETKDEKLAEGQDE